MKYTFFTWSRYRVVNRFAIQNKTQYIIFKYTDLEKQLSVRTMRNDTFSGDPGSYNLVYLISLRQSLKTWTTEPPHHFWATNFRWTELLIWRCWNGKLVFRSFGFWLYTLSLLRGDSLSRKSSNCYRGERRYRQGDKLHWIRSHKYRVRQYVENYSGLYPIRGYLLLEALLYRRRNKVNSYFSGFRSSLLFLKPHLQSWVIK